ncbi:MAG: hypothetical protein JXR84_15325 [Anaerolineae bacterium]|nr:hypothetical protein [Anaerolineae bacterium]
MGEQKKQYILAAVFVIVALVLGYFGISFPESPEIPAPLPTATPVDIGQLADAVSTRLGMGESGQSFTVSSDPTSNVPCYMAQGGEEWVADDGCTWGLLSGATLEVQSGSTLDIQSGATVQMSAGGTFGNTIITGTLAVSGTTDLVGVVSSSTGAVTVTDDLQVNGNTTMTGTLSVGGDVSRSGADFRIADNVIVTGTLSLEGVAFSGPVVFGTASNVVTGTEIAHTLGVTPTTWQLTPLYAGAFTNTVYLVSANATTITIGIGYTTGVTTVTSIGWMVGR